MIAKVVFEDDGDNVLISTEGAISERGTVAQNAAMAVYNKFTREHRVLTNEVQKQTQTTYRSTNTGHSKAQDARNG